MKSRLLLWSITASLAGFLFGFDTIFISGAEEDFQRLWQLDGFWHGLCMSAALWGTVLGAIFGGMPAAAFGRRYTDYDAAKGALVEASSLDVYEGDPVVIPAGSSYEETRDLAAEATAAAKRFLGFKSMLVLCCLIGFIAAHAIGQGTVIWVFIGEIFPNDHRATGQSLGSATHWGCAAGLSFLFPIAMEHFEPGQLLRLLHVHDGLAARLGEVSGPGN